MTYKKGQKNFNIDLKESNRVVAEIVNPILESRGVKLIRNSNSEDKIERKQFDGIYTIGEKIFTIEHKTDYRCAETGNIFLEHHDRGKSSGITTTTADYITYYVLEKLYIIETSKFKEILHLAFNDDVKGGDDYLARGYLFKWNKIRDYFKCMS